MDVGPILQVAGVGMLISILNVLLKQAGKEEHAQMVTLAGVIIALLMIVPLVQRMISTTRAAFGI